MNPSTAKNIRLLDIRSAGHIGVSPFLERRSNQPITAVGDHLLHSYYLLSFYVIFWLMKTKSIKN